MAKHPMASIDGTFIEQPTDVSYDGVVVRFNPKEVHLFVDEEGYAIQYAEEVTVLAHRAYVRGKIVYYSEELAPPKVGSANSSVKFKR